MKLKIFRLAGTVEVEGTAEELASFVKGLEAPSLASGPPAASGYANLPNPFESALCSDGSFHEYPELYNGDPPCKKCQKPMIQYQFFRCVQNDGPQFPATIFVREPGQQEPPNCTLKSGTE